MWQKHGKNVAKFEQNVANSDKTEFLPMGLFRLVDLVLHLNIISLSITVRVVSLASLLSIDGLSLWHRSKSSELRHKYRLRWSYFTQLNPAQIIIPTKINPQKTFTGGPD